MTNDDDHQQLCWELVEAGKHFIGLQTLLYRAALRLDRYKARIDSLQRQLLDLATRPHGDGN